MLGTDKAACSSELPCPSAVGEGPRSCPQWLPALGRSAWSLQRTLPGAEEEQVDFSFELKKKNSLFIWVLADVCRIFIVVPGACGILVPRPGIEPTSPALEVGFLPLGHRESLQAGFAATWGPQKVSAATTNSQGGRRDRQAARASRTPVRVHNSPASPGKEPHHACSCLFLIPSGVFSLHKAHAHMSLNEHIHITWGTFTCNGGESHERIWSLTWRRFKW